MKSFRSLAMLMAMLLTLMALFLAIPALYAFFLRQPRLAMAFVQVMGGALALGLALYLFSLGNKGLLSTKSGLIFVALSWLCVSALGALPYWISGFIPSYTDAFFESMSGFTTTGASILRDIERMPRPILLWRSMTCWLGGMGIVALTVALAPFLGVGGFRLVRAESSGQHPERVAAQIGKTVKYLWILYLVLTLCHTALSLFLGLGLYDAVSLAFTSISTSGFGIKNDSLASYSAAVQNSATLFMLLGGINFSLYFWLLRGKFRMAFDDSEFKAYLGVAFGATLLIAVCLLTKNVYGGGLAAWRHAAFQAVSIMTTTGFATADYEKWPVLAQMVLFMLFFIGGSASSTAGGIKVSRIVALVKQGIAEIKQEVYPQGVFAVIINGKAMDKAFLTHVSGFFILYIASALAGSMVAASSGVDMLTSITASMACLGNIGPGFGLAGPVDNYAFFAPYVKAVLAFLMLLGRLELFTIFAFFTPVFWRRWND